MFNPIKLFSFTLLSLVTISDAAKILAVFQWPSISHHMIFRHITEELARRGHEVTVITTDAAYPKGKAPSHLTEIDLHDFSYDVWRKAMEKQIKDEKDFLGRIEHIGNAINEVLESQFKSFEVQKLLNETKDFELILTEASVRPSLIFSHFYKVPVIMVSSFGTIVLNDRAMGMPTHPLLYPSLFSGKHYNHTMLEKITEIYNYFITEWYFGGKSVQTEDNMLKNVFGPNIPSVVELYENVDMLFLNTHPLWASNVPVPPNVVFIWGIHKKPVKKLPEDLQSFLDSSKNGVIYMSFGTNSPPSALPAETIQAFVTVFSKLPYDVLWKWDKDELPGRTENIKIGKWFPQSDILRHPKVKLFITHCGLQSTDEAITAGVPLVGIPLVADQHFNMEKYLNFKIAEKVDIKTMTAEDLRNAIQTVLSNESYRQNIIKLRDIMRDEPESALERAVWWTEYVLRHKGAKHLRAAGANLSYAEYYEIPLVSSIFLILISFCIITTLLIKRLTKLITKSSLKLKTN